MSITARFFLGFFTGFLTIFITGSFLISGVFTSVCVFFSVTTAAGLTFRKCVHLPGPICFQSLGQRSTVTKSLASGWANQLHLLHGDRGRGGMKLPLHHNIMYSLLAASAAAAAAANPKHILFFMVDDLGFNDVCDPVAPRYSVFTCD